MAFKRPDGRKPDELRPIKAEVGVVPNAQGSARFEIGNTVAIAAVYGPRELHPKFMQNPKTGILRCHYGMMPFSGQGDRVRPGPNRRAKEISMVITKALNPVIDLSEYPNAVVDVFIDCPQTDAGTRCAALTAASMALADAGISMKDLVSAVAVGYVEGKLVADLSYEEEAMEATDIPVAALPSSGQVTLLQMDGECSREDLKKALELAVETTKELYEVQKKALKAKYQVKA